MPSLPSGPRSSPPRSSSRGPRGAAADRVYAARSSARLRRGAGRALGRARLRAAQPTSRRRPRRDAARSGCPQSDRRPRARHLVGELVKDLEAPPIARRRRGDDRRLRRPRPPVPPAADADRRLPAVHVGQHRRAEGRDGRPPQRRRLSSTRCAERYGYRPSTTASRRRFDLTFDLSVFDLFVTWERGACVCCPSRSAAAQPRPLRPRRASSRVWFSVPSLAIFMRRLGMLKPDTIPTCAGACSAASRCRSRSRARGPRRRPLDRREPLRPDRGDDRLRRLPLGPGRRSPATASDGVVPIGQPARRTRPCWSSTRACARSRPARTASCWWPARR